MSINDFIANNSELFSKMNDIVMSKDLTPVKEGYIDLVNLKDLRFGLMYSTSNESERKYLKERISKYNLRPNRKFTYAYPDLQYKESEYTKMYFDEKYHESMFDYAPDTDLVFVFPSFLSTFIERNTRIGYREKFKLTINTYPIKHSKNLEIYKRLMNSYVGRSMDLKFICCNPKEIDSEFWARQNVIICDDVKQLTDEDSSCSKPLCKDQVMLSTKIFCPYNADDEAIERWSKLDESFIYRLSDLVAPTEIILQMVCMFKYIPCCIPIRSDLNG